MGEAGEAACYALCIIEIAERVSRKSIDPIDAFYKAFDKKYIRYNEKNPNDNDNFFIDNAAGFLSMLTGGKWMMEKVENPKYIAKTGEYVVDRWERKTTGNTIAHFRLADWDPVIGSVTVKNGKIVSKRVFRKIA